jgi:hypothetical protein
MPGHRADARFRGGAPSALAPVSTGNYSTMSMVIIPPSEEGVEISSFLPVRSRPRGTYNLDASPMGRGSSVDLGLELAQRNLGVKSEHMPAAESDREPRERTEQAPEECSEF